MSGRLSFQHNYSRLVVDEYCSFVYSERTTDVVVTAQSRGIESIVKSSDTVTPGGPYPIYLINLRKDFPVTRVIEENSDPENDLGYYHGSLVFVDAAIRLDYYPSYIYLPRAKYIPRVEDITQSRQVEITVHQLYDTGGGTLAMLVTEAYTELSVILCRPLHPDFTEKSYEPAE